MGASSTVVKDLVPRIDKTKEAFAWQIVHYGRNIQDAARAAGISESYGVRLSRDPAVMAFIRAEITRRLTVEALPLSYNVLVEIARDKTVLPAIRRAAARDLIDRAGVVPPKAKVNDNAAESRPLSEMSNDELRGLVDRLEAELGARAVPIEAAPADSAQNAPAKTAKPLDFLD